VLLGSKTEVKGGRRDGFEDGKREELDRAEGKNERGGIYDG
jgi:hypothetical protein